VQIEAATLSDNSLRQTVHTHSVSVHEAAKTSKGKEGKERGKGRGRGEIASWR